MSADRPTVNITATGPIPKARSAVRETRLTLPPAFGVPDDQVDRLRHARAASLIGLVVGSGFAWFNLALVDQTALGLVEALAVLLLVLPAYLLSRDERTVDGAEWLMLASAWVIFGALVVLGGVDGTGLFWVPTVPFLAYFLRPARQAGWSSLGFLLLTAGYLGWTDAGARGPYAYGHGVAVQFVLSQAFFIVVAAAFHHVRSRYEVKLREQRAHAQAMARAKSHFLAAVSHDLRQPVQALSLFADALAQAPASVGKPTELVRGVGDATRALQAMLEQFSVYVALDGPDGPEPCVPQSLSVAQVLQELNAQFQPLAQARGVRLHVRAGPGGHLWADPACLRRVLANLVTNAVAFSPSGAVLVVCRLAHDPGWLRLQVRDNGVGMDAAVHERVFDEFYQVDNPQRDRSRGIGLGLSVVRRLCQRMGLRLHLRSAPGRGTVVELRVPAASA